MTISEFFDKYNGKGIDFDHSFGKQCVDLYRQYVQEVLGLPQSPPVKGAAWIRYTYDKNLYDWFDNTILAVPKPGDILIWDTRAGGGFGHVAIYVNGNVLYFTSFDLNWPSQGYYDNYGNFIGTGVCHFQGHNYFGGLVGWLRPKTALQPLPAPSVHIPDAEFRQKVKDIILDNNLSDIIKISKIKALGL